MNDIAERRQYKPIESDEQFLGHLQEVSKKLGLEPGQILKACFAIGWDQLTQTLMTGEKEHIDDKTELE